MLAVERMSVDVASPGTPAPRHLGTGRRVLSLLAIAAALAGLWARGLPRFVAWEVARDHERCFGRRLLPARLWSSDPTEIRDWLESRGTPTPFLPARPNDADLVGVRYCPLADRVAAHVYYGGAGALPLSIFLLSGPARIGDGWSGRARGLHVRLLRAAGLTVAIVGANEADVAGAARSFTSTVARLASDPSGCAFSGALSARARRRRARRAAPRDWSTARARSPATRCLAAPARTAPSPGGW